MIRRSSAFTAAIAVATLWCSPVRGQTPDIQGFWANQSHRLATYNIEGAADPTHVFLSGNPTDETSLVVDPPDGKIPYQPWAKAKRDDVLEHHLNITKWEYVDPHTRCFLSGIPRMFYQGTFQILQPPGYIVILQDHANILGLVSFRCQLRRFEHLSEFKVRFRQRISDK